MTALKRIRNIIGYAAGVLVFIFIFLAGFTQTKFFKDRLRSILVSELSSRLNGSLALGTIRGNFLTGFTLDSVAVYYGEEKIFSSGKVTCKYNLLSLPKKSIHVDYIIIEQPSMHFFRTPQGEWNISQMIKPAERTVGGQFDEAVIIDNLELKNAFVSLSDSTTSDSVGHIGSQEKYFDYHHFTLRDLNAKMNGAITSNSYNVHVTHASFYSSTPQFELTHFAGMFTASQNGLSIKDVIIQTGHSYLELDGKLKGNNILKGPALSAMGDDSAQLHFSAKNIDFAELKILLPHVSFLQGSAVIDIDAGGKFGDLNLQRVYVKTYKSTLKLAGKVQNLHRPHELFIDVFAGDSKFDPSDASKLLPSFHLPGFNEAGLTSFSARFVGKPLKFKSNATLRGQLGSVEIEDELNFESNLPRYTFSFKTDKFNLLKITGDPRFKTSLSCRGEFAGEGTSPDNITARLKLALDSTQVQNFSLQHSTIEIDALPHHFEGTATLNAGETRANIVSELNMTDPQLPSFASRFSVSALDLSRLFGDQKYKTNLNLKASLSGAGKNIDNASGDLGITLYPSTIGHYNFSQDTISFSLNQHDPDNKHISLQSSTADVDLTGKFDIDIAANALQQQFNTLLRAIAKHASMGDTVEIANDKIQRKIEQHSEAERQMDFRYSFNIKNLEAVSSIMNETPFNTQCRFDGRVRGDDRLLSIDTKGTFDELFVGSIKKGFLFHHGTLAIQVNNISAEKTLEKLSARVDLTIESGISKALTLDSVQATLRYENNKNVFSLNGIIDSTYSVSLNGSSSTQPRTYAIDLDNITLAKDSYVWKNQDDIQLRINRDGIRIMHALLKRDSASVSFTGLIADSGAFDLTMALRKFPLDALSNHVNSVQTQQANHLQGNVSADIHLGGTTLSPRIDFIAQAENLSYRNSNVGSASATIRYADQLATIDVDVKHAIADSLPYLTIKGTVPIDLALVNIPERFPDKEQHLSIRSERFTMSALEPLLREFQNLTGNITCDVIISGTPRNPQYSGSLSIKDSRFTFVPNNVEYSVSGVLEPQGEKIALKNFTIRNVSTDRVDGEARVEGTLVLKDFRIENFDFTLYGQLLFMTDATRKTIPTMYGTLFAATGANGLHLNGTLDRPFLSGNLFVRDANLTFPPAKQAVGATTGMKLSYIVIDDTSKIKQTQSVLSEQFFAHDTIITVRTTAIASSEFSLIDRLRYDVAIETQGPTRIRMIFTPSTNEELYAELDGKVNALNYTGTPNIYGEITVSPNSYYNFFKKFDANGTLKFTGQWDNPELDIKATYEGMKIIDTTAQKVIVELNITGKRYEPKLEMGMKVQLAQGQDPVDWATKSNDVQSDAISFILTGKFRDELTSKDKEGIVANVGSTAGTSAVSGFTSTFLSGMLSDFLRKEFPFIRSAEVTYQGGNLQESADLRLSGEAFKGYWRFGGKIFNDIGNANVNYQVSLGDVFNASTIRNLFIELERKVEGSEFEERKLTNAARIYYRISF